MFDYLTPSTLEAMYNDLNETRIDLLQSVNDSNLIAASEAYRQATNHISDIVKHYENLTGENLIIKMELVYA